MSVSHHKTLLRRLIGAALLLGSGPALAERFNFQPPVTPSAHAEYHLHMTVFWICVVIAAVVFGAMFYSIFAHRKSKGAVAATFHENTKLEILWTVIPFAILIVVAVPATKALLFIENTSNADLTVKVTGIQWKWKYEYVGTAKDPANDVKFISQLPAAQFEVAEKGNAAAIAKINTPQHPYLLTVDHDLVLPIKKRIRFLITGADVIHSFFIPQFGIKKDAIPGYVNETWTEIQKPGIYYGQCAELCGKGHAFMPIVVRAVTQDEFNKWLAKQKAAAAAAAAEAASNKVWSKAELYAMGDKIFHGKGGCFGCHGANGQGLANFPALKGSKVATGPIPKHLHTVLFGVKGTPMQAFGEQLNNLEIAAVVTFERNAWGNDTGDVIQPKQVAAARKAQ
jgi:cytochrome c oxidase subunit 2